MKSANLIKQWVYESGFDLVGITDPDVSAYQKHFKEWLDSDYCADMQFLKNNLEKRLNPLKLMPEAKSIICVGVNYFSKETAGLAVPYFSRYLTNKDYHSVIKDRLPLVAEKIKIFRGDFQYRVFCDSAPVLEKPLAEKAGLGWIGKNGLLINKKLGSFFFLGELFVDFELPIDKPAQNHCGTCERCIKKCPTKAIVTPKTIDAKKCISYLTIEQQKEINFDAHQHIFGCDECQNACPWNQFAKETSDPELKPLEKLKNQSIETLSQWTEDEFIKNTEGTVLERLGFSRWKQRVKSEKRSPFGGQETKN